MEELVRSNQRLKKKFVTYLDAVNTLWPEVTISLIDESVFISAKLSHVLTFHRRIIPPRQLESKTSPDIAIPDTHPLCALLSDCNRK